MSLRGITSRMSNGPHVLRRPAPAVLDERGVWQAAVATDAPFEGGCWPASGESAQYLPQGVQLSHSIEVYAEVELRATPGAEDVVLPGGSAPPSMQDSTFKVVAVRSYAQRRDGYTLWVAVAARQEIP